MLINFAKVLNMTSLEICEFERRVTDSLDMEQSTEDQVWDEQDHMRNRRRSKRRKKMAYVALAMVGGSLVLGLSGGLLAPVIGGGDCCWFVNNRYYWCYKFLDREWVVPLLLPFQVLLLVPTSVLEVCQKGGKCKNF